MAKWVYMFKEGFAKKVRAFVENGCVVHDDMQVHREKKRYNKASKKRSK